MKVKVTITEGQWISHIFELPDGMTAEELEDKLSELSLNWYSFEKDAEMALDTNVEEVMESEPVSARDYEDFMNRYFDAP